MFFKNNSPDVDYLLDQLELIYNPDPFVNRMNLIIRLKNFCMIVLNLHYKV